MAGLVNDNVRDTPDVSLMAANGLWGHYYMHLLYGHDQLRPNQRRNCFLHRDRAG